MKKNSLMHSAELADLLNGIKDVLLSVQSQLTAQDLRITKIEEYLAEDVVAMFAAGEQDPAPDQDQKDQRHSARWKGAGLGEYSCSWCGEVVCGSSHNFCPSCGSFMNPAPDSEVSDGE